jgi:hypothetical protein
MGRYELKFCDLCGKRTSNLPGRLVLFSEVERRPKEELSYKTQRTVWGRKVCTPCLKRLSALESVGDRLRDAIETRIDEAYIEQKYLVEKHIEAYELNMLPREVKKENHTKIYKNKNKEE